MLKKLRKYWLSVLSCGAACLATGIAIGNTALPGVNSTLATVFTYAYEASPDKPTYSATTGAFTLATNPTSVCALSGSATKMIRVRRVFWSATLATAAVESLDLVIRTAGYSAGNGTGVTAVPLDQNSAVATAQMDVWTANPTYTGGSPLRALLIAYSAATSPLSLPPYIFPIGELDQAVILRNANQWLEVNLNGSLMTGGSGYCTFEWTEE